MASGKEAEMTYQYAVVIVKEGRRFWAYIPALPGVYGSGKTAPLAKKDLSEALKLYIADCRSDGDPVPPSHIQSVKVDHIKLAA